MTPRRAVGGLLAGAAVVGVLTLLARLAGFGRILVFAGTVGANPVGSAYNTANQLPNVLFEVVAGGALAGAVVPLLAGPIARATRGGAPRVAGVPVGADQDAAEVRAALEEGDRTASALLTWAVTVLVPVAALLAVFAGPITAALLGATSDSSGATPEQADLARRMLVVFAPQIVLYGVGVVLTGVLQAHRRFVWPALAPLLSSAVVMLAYLLFAALGGTADPATLDAGAEAALVWGTTAGVAVLTLPLLVPVARTGVRLRPTWRFPPGVARRAGRLAAAGLITLLAQQLSVLAVIHSANDIDPAGGYTVYLYAQSVYLLPYGVLVVPLATVAFPRLAAAAARGDAVGFARTSALTTRAVLLVAAAGAAALVAVAPDVQAFFRTVGSERSSGAVEWLSPVLSATAPGLVGFAVVALVGRALYSLERGRAAAATTAAGWLVVTVVAVLAGSDAVAGAADGGGTTAAMTGLGLANTAGMTVAGLALLLALRRAAGPAALAGVPRTLLVVLPGAALGALAARWLLPALDTTALGATSGAAGDASGGWLPAVAHGAAAGLVALVVLALVVAAADRTALREVLALRRRPPTAPPPQEAPR